MTDYDLIKDGDTFDLEDGRTLRLRILPDDMLDPFEHFDCYGKVAYGGTNRDTGHETRPEGFDGNAERISIITGPIWWQPPADVKRTDEGFASLRSLVRDVASFGMVGYVVELLASEDDADFYHHRPVVTAASLWGVETMADGEYAASIVADLIDEVMA